MGKIQYHNLFHLNIIVFFISKDLLTYFILTAIDNTLSSVNIQTQQHRQYNNLTSEGVRGFFNNICIVYACQFMLGL